MSTADIPERALERVAERVVRAPGKVVLVGEYAVIDGHRALAAAVDVCATVTCTPSPFLVLEGNLSGAIPASERAELSARLPLLAAVVDEMRARGLVFPALHARVDTSAFAHSGKKIGLGSSAAAASAVVRALMPTALLTDVFSVARAAHRAFQGGGSGIDVATSCYGRVISFCDGTVEAAPPLPTALAWIIAYVGESTSTQGFVDRYRALADRPLHAARLAAAADAFLAACTRADAPALLSAIDDARDAMARMGQAAGIDVVSAPHAQIAALARTHGGAAKPSGAGGGDVALCAVPADRRGALVDALTRAGFFVLDAQLGAPGVDGAF